MNFFSLFFCCQHVSFLKNNLLSLPNRLKKGVLYHETETVVA